MSIELIVAVMTACTWAGIPAYPERGLQRDEIQPFAIVSDDFDGDGWSDFILATTNKGFSLVTRGTTGELQEDSILDAIPLDSEFYYGRTLVAGDFDGDGKLDAAAVLVEVDTGKGIISILASQGGGLFARKDIITYGAVTSLEALDIDEDGADDIIACVRDGDTDWSGMVLIRGAPDFVMDPETLLPETPTPAVGAVVAGGSPRRIVACADGDVYVADLEADGSISVAGWREIGDWASHSKNIRAGDIDGDGADEVLLWGDEGLAVGRPADGFFWKLHDGSELKDAAALPGKVAIADGSYDALVWIDLSKGFDAPAKTIYSTGGIPQCLVIWATESADTPQLAVALLGALWHDERVWGSIVLPERDGEGLRLPVNDAPLGIRVRHLALADLDGDGDLDGVAVGGQMVPGDDSVPYLIVLERESGRWTEAERIEASQNLGPARFADLNGDGMLDVVAGCSSIDFPTGDSVEVFLAREPLVYSGGRTAYPVGEYPIAVEVGDLDVDGTPDIAAAVHGCECHPGNTSFLAVLTGNGGGTFLAARTFSARQYARGLTLRDLDADGIAEVIMSVSNWADWNGAIVLKRDDDGSYYEDGEYGMPDYAQVTTMGDADGDGEDEAVSAGGEAITICNLSREGLESPLAIQYEMENFWPTAVAVGDADGDGTPDLLLSRSVSDAGPQDRFFFFRGQGGGTFAAAREVLAGSIPLSMGVRSLAPGEEPVVATAGSLFEHQTSFIVTLPRSAFADSTTPTFIRGDSNRDGGVDLSDAVATLVHLFSGGSISCKDAADGNDDGKVDISDPVYVLTHLFLGGEEPKAPFPAAGIDPTDDALGCED
jgi:hypothetical protein